MTPSNYKICVIGLGYVGLPLARLFSTKFRTVGFDMNQSRVDALMAGHDATLKVSDGQGCKDPDTWSHLQGKLP